MSLNGTLKPTSVYIVLKSRPIPGEFHWALIVTDTDASPTLHHATNLAGPWRYEAKSDKPTEDEALIAIMLVDGIRSHHKVTEILRAVPADGNPSQRTGENSNCLTWMKDALVQLAEDGEIHLTGSIDELESLAASYGTEYSPVSETGGGATVINNPRVASSN